MTNGKTSRMPNTATSTPTVRKMFCQKWLSRSRYLALTAALSNEKTISTTIRIAVRPTPVQLL